MSTKALITVNHNGQPLAYLHAAQDGYPFSIGVKLLDALAESSTPAEVLAHLAQEPGTTFNWAKLTTLDGPVGEMPSTTEVERQFEYTLDLQDTELGLRANQVRVHNRFKADQSDYTGFVGNAGAFLNSILRVAKHYISDKAFVNGAEGKLEFLADMVELTKGLVALSPAPFEAAKVEAPSPMKPVVAEKPTSGVVMSEVQREIAHQVSHILQMNGKSLQGYAFVTMPDDNELRVSKGRRNVDIALDFDADLYNVKLHVIDNTTFDVSTKSHKGMYVDQLPEMLKHLEGRGRVKDDRGR